MVPVKLGGMSPAAGVLGWRGRQGMWVKGVLLHVRERFDCRALTVSTDLVENLWESIRGMENKAEIVRDV